VTAPDSRKAALKADPRLDAYFADEEERRRVTREMFDQAAAGYDEAERLTGLGSGPWYRREVLKRSGLAAGMHLLDVAAGTGLVTVPAQALVGPQGRVLALDPSPGMLAELRKKLNVETIEGYAEAIPLPDAHVDFISMGYALRHVGDLDQALAEYFRVLRPGGRVCLMEICRPQSRLGQWLLAGYIRGVVPALSRLLGSRADVGRLWEYYGDTINAAADPEVIMNALRGAGFVDVQSPVTLGIFREYLARKPD
jgi:demethylmenaquinone methyltransferase / 2-methoxy-6-polyprenyl-1,4-benzoquinol methylase